MAHKTLVNGTAYDMGGGVTLVSGTSYHIKNGKVLIGGTAYDISFVLPPAVLDLWSGTTSSIKCIAYGNGYWVVGGSFYDGSTHYARIAYATSLDGTWTMKDLWSNRNNGSSINCIAYANGYWVVGGQYYDGSTYYARFAYATSPSGTWTTKDSWSEAKSSCYYSCVTYANGYWVLGGRDYYYHSSSTSYTYAKIAYATSPSGTWKSKTLWSVTNAPTDSTTNCIKCIAYANGYWVAGGIYYKSATSGGRIAYATSLDGTWATKNLWGNSGVGSSINCIAYANGYWVVGGKHYANNTGHARIAYATSLDGTWTKKDLWGSSSDDCLNCIAYADGYWVVGGQYYTNSTGYGRIAYTTSPSGTWTTKDVWSSTDSSQINCVIRANGHWVVGGMYNTDYARIAYADSLDELGNTE